ncbi:MAG: thermonuclease family protein [Acidobacteriota bacterium]
MLSSLLVAVLLAATAAPATKDPCGDAATVSQGYRSLSGRVVEVTSGDSIRVQMDEKSPYRDPSLTGVQAFRLVAIEAPSADQELGKRSQQRLSERLVGKVVNLGMSPVQKEGTPRNVLVAGPDGALAGENEGQLEAGLARVVEQGPYDVDGYLRCTFEAAQARARKAGLGIWMATAPAARNNHR